MPARTSRRGIKIIIEKHRDGFVAYPLGLQGVVVGQGDTYEAALADVKSAIKFHVATFGKKVLAPSGTVMDAYIAKLRRSHRGLNPC